MTQDSCTSAGIPRIITTTCREATFNEKNSVFNRFVYTFSVTVTDLDLGGRGGFVLRSLSAFLPSVISCFFCPKQEWPLPRSACVTADLNLTGLDDLVTFSGLQLLVL